MSSCLCDCHGSRVAAFSMHLHPNSHASAQVAWLGRKYNAASIRANPLEPVCSLMQLQLPTECYVLPIDWAEDGMSG